jgi:dTDP-glucose 4,6-dehydratase
MVNVSTDEVYGHLDLWDAPFTELSPLNPRSPYSASKASADLIVNSYVETYGLKIITTRCCNNYGPNQHDEKFIPTVIRKMMNGLPIPVYGTGENIREWIYVEDHIKSILDLVESGSVGWVYNIGSGVEKTNLDIVKTIAKLLEMSPNIEFVEDRKGHDFRYALESVRCWADFAPIDFSEGMQRTVDFYKGKWVNNKSE